MNREREARLEQVALYALGVLSTQEAAEVGAFIRTDPEARAEYESLRGAADAIALGAEEAVDPIRTARMRERLLARVRPAPRRSSRAARYALWLALAASLIFAIVTAVQDIALRGELASTQRRTAELFAPGAKRYAVAAGSVIVRGPRIYLALSLPPLPHGRVYQAWTAAKGTTTMVPSVTFTPNANGLAIVELPVDAARIGIVALSVEPSGGSKAPTTAPIFVRPLT
jgi:anti-sigma-K factor RskA